MLLVEHTMGCQGCALVRSGVAPAGLTARLLAFPRVMSSAWRNIQDDEEDEEEELAFEVRARPRRGAQIRPDSSDPPVPSPSELA